MEHTWLYFLILTLIALIIQGFYSMLEMACVSFNKVRLQYYVSKKKKRAVWLSRLLQNPARLFGTTLIGVNTALQFGSECSRRFYASLGVSPDWAPLSQVIIVLILAELVPMFAARKYAENVTMLGVPIIYVSSMVMRPVIWILDLICRAINRLFRISAVSGLYLTRDELQKAIEEKEDPTKFFEEKELDTISRNIFALKTKTAKDLMESLDGVEMVSSDSTVSDIKQNMGLVWKPFLPVYHLTKENIVAVAYARDFIRLSEDSRIRPYARSPWFITEKNSVLQILKQFRENKQSLAIVLDQVGKAVGMLTLDAVVDEIFGQKDEWLSLEQPIHAKRRIFVERSYRGDTKIETINLELHIDLKAEEGVSLEDLMEKELGHHPEKGESVVIGEFELIVEESSLIRESTIIVRSR